MENGKFSFSKTHNQENKSHAKEERKKAGEEKIYQAGFNQAQQIERYYRRSDYYDFRLHEISLLKRPVIAKKSINI